MLAQRLAALAVLALVASPAAAQAPSPRDTRPAAQTGSAVIRGRVFAADTKRPLRRARITLTAPELAGQNRTTSTDADGRYEIKDLPAGRYTLAVTRSGYLRLSYGQSRPFEQGRPLQLAVKQLVDDVDFVLPRMSLIAGRVVDETGEPIEGVRMYAMRTLFFEGRRQLVPAGGGPSTTTDDAGEYRIADLAPGSYYVMADMRETWTVTEAGIEQVMGYSPTYFPSTTVVTEARRVAVGVGELASNTDFALIPARAANVSGRAVDSQGRPLAGRQVTLVQEYRGPTSASMMAAGNAPVGADGAFTFRNITPGTYKAQVRSTTDNRETTLQESAVAIVTVDGVDLDNVNLITSGGWAVSGSVTIEDGQSPTVARDRIRVVGTALNRDLARAGTVASNVDSGRVRDDWTFTVTGLMGPSRLGATVPDGWIVKSILYDRRDIADEALEARGGETVADIRVVLSDRVNIVTGQLTDQRGEPVAEGTVIVFARDPQRWIQDSRFVRSARPDQAGQYQISGLPAGEYLAVALTYVEEGMWNDPEYLQSIQTYGQPLILGEAGTHALPLKLTTP